MNYVTNFCVLFVVSCNLIFASQKPIRMLHLTFHQGCAREIEEVAKVLGFTVETWFIQNLPPLFFDGVSQGNVLYNIGHDRAHRVWKLHQSTFEQFDVVLTSDTAPLARIFLQNHFKKPLIIWICNRFDYSDQASLDCHFPDPEFYQLFQEASHKENVRVVAYNVFEHEYARRKGIYTGNLTITPCSPQDKQPPAISAIPSAINRAETFFLTHYTNDVFYHKKCQELGIPVYQGKYNGSADLSGFKAIIHFPYAWSNLAFFENISLGIPYLIPSVSFLRTLLQNEQYWFTGRGYLVEKGLFHFSEWYLPGREEIITYFDSWEDLQLKTCTINFSALSQRIKQYAERYRTTMLEKWTKLLNELCPQ